ncbi:MAG TPA: glycosyltransferase family 4 protein [Candidatus Acidoferrales bacterium]|nr:glycosyltransferase family 4 protein [Candidatus Acidoferrales bacterium]
MPQKKPCLFVVSPFVDKRHGTERRVAEWLTRLSDTFQIHLYSQRVEDLDLSRINWHRIPKLPGPHLLSYLWWFLANHLWRIWDCRIRRICPDMIFSPGINCLDADVMSVHIVFAEYRVQNEMSLRFSAHSIGIWPVILHRKLYYNLLMFLERRLYCDKSRSLILISRRTSTALRTFYGRREPLPVIYLGLDHHIFSTETRRRLRNAARRDLGLLSNQFVLLLIGNDWRNKGLGCLLEALAQLRDLPIYVLVVGQDDSSSYRKLIQRNECARQIEFLSPRKDVEFLYAAADAYVGPSQEDTFALPPAEAMACGLPVITSTTNGTSEIIQDGIDGLLLRNPSDSNELASLIRKLYESSSLRERMGAKAAEKMLQFSWERNGREMTDLLLQVLEAKKSGHASAVRQEA